MRSPDEACVPARAGACRPSSAALEGPSNKLPALNCAALGCELVGGMALGTLGRDQVSGLSFRHFLQASSVLVLFSNEQLGQIQESSRETAPSSLVGDSSSATIDRSILLPAGAPPGAVSPRRSSPGGSGRSHEGDGSEGKSDGGGAFGSRAAARPGGGDDAGEATAPPRGLSSSHAVHQRSVSWLASVHLGQAHVFCPGSGDRAPVFGSAEDAAKGGEGAGTGSRPIALAPIGIEMGAMSPRGFSVEHIWQRCRFFSLANVHSGQGQRPPSSKE